jgi:hypothetical protein
MVKVPSSWFPLAKPEDFQKAIDEAFRQKGAASGVELPVPPKL